MSASQLAEARKRAQAFLAGDIPAQLVEIQTVGVAPPGARGQPRLSPQPTVNGIPATIMAQIKQKATSRYPTDYEMQEYVIKSQVEAYKALQNFSSAGIPAQVFAQIRSDAISRYPSDYEMQEYVIKTQIEAYKRLH